MLELAPEPEVENDIRVYLDNNLIEEVQNNIEYEGLLPIPNDDEDYADYVDPFTEDSDIYGPFRSVYLDLSQIDFNKDINLKGAKSGKNGTVIEFKNFCITYRKYYFTNWKKLFIYNSIITLL